MSQQLVVIHNPALMGADIPYLDGKEEWQTDLMGCCKDPKSCIITCLFPCLQYANNQTAIDESAWLDHFCAYCILSGLPGYIHYSRRQLFKKKYNLKNFYINDYVTTCFFPCCAIIQEAREIQARAGPAAQAM